MNEVFQFLIFGVPLAAIGLYIDRMLLRHQKVFLHDRLTRIWIEIDEATFPEVAKRIAQRVVDVVSFSGGARYRIKLLAKLVVLSWLFTSFASAIGEFMSGSRTLNPYDWLPIFPVYFVNGFFDAATIVITFFVLRSVAHSGPLKIVALVAFNAAIAMALMIASLPLLVWSSNVAIARNWPGSGDQIYHLVNGISDLLSFDEFFDGAVKKHLKEHPNEPFVLKQPDWSGTDASGRTMSAKNIDVRVQLKPGVTGEQYESEMKKIRAYVRAKRFEMVMAGDVEFTMAQPFRKYYSQNLHEILFDFQTWTPSLKGDLSGKGPGWNTTAAAVSIPQYKWPFVLVSATSLIPTVALAFVLGLLACLKIARDFIAAVTKHLIERSTEEDPRNAPEKFAPFTFFFCVLGTLLCVFRALATLVANQFLR